MCQEVVVRSFVVFGMDDLDLFIPGASQVRRQQSYTYKGFINLCVH